MSSSDKQVIGYIYGKDGSTIVADIEKVIGDGSCFFRSVARAIEALKGGDLSAERERAMAMRFRQFACDNIEYRLTTEPLYTDLILPAMIDSKRQELLGRYDFEIASLENESKEKVKFIERVEYAGSAMIAEGGEENCEEEDVIKLALHMSEAEAKRSEIAVLRVQIDDKHRQKAGILQELDDLDTAEVEKKREFVRGYIEQMRRPETLSGELEIRALQDEMIRKRLTIMRIIVVYYSPVSSRYEIFNQNAISAGLNPIDMVVIYNGNDHYDTVRFRAIAEPSSSGRVSYNINDINQKGIAVNFGMPIIGPKDKDGPAHGFALACGAAPAQVDMDDDQMSLAVARSSIDLADLDDLDENPTADVSSRPRTSL